MRIRGSSIRAWLGGVTKRDAKENRLVSQTTTPLAAAAGVPLRKIEHSYDWQSRRIRKTVFSSTNGSTWTLESDERFVYNSWNPLAIFDASGGTLTLKQTCLWGLDLSGTLQGAGGVGGLLATTSHSALPTCHFPSYDGNGNIIAWTASNGDTLQRIDYDPFGNVVTRESAPGFEAPAWGFSTKYQDKETGLLYYGFRFYDPVAGRWSGRDPIEEKGGMNLYGFVGNEGVGRHDFLGLASPEIQRFDVSGRRNDINPEAEPCSCLEPYWIFKPDIFGGTHPEDGVKRYMSKSKGIEVRGARNGLLYVGADKPIDSCLDCEYQITVGLGDYRGEGQPLQFNQFNHVYDAGIESFNTDYLAPGGNNMLVQTYKYLNQRGVTEDWTSGLYGYVQAYDREKREIKCVRTFDLVLPRRN